MSAQFDSMIISFDRNLFVIRNKLINENFLPFNSLLDFFYFPNRAIMSARPGDHRAQHA